MNNRITSKGGVLIIGSLLWDSSDIRKNWRENDLILSEKIQIGLPIRYGRVSQSRSCTHSMVYSSACKLENKLGLGYLVPFKNISITVEEILRLSKRIIDAEHNKIKNLNRFNWGWGCLGIAFNPALDEDEKIMILDRWKSKYGNGFNPKEYRVGNETPIITKTGKLLIDWMSQLDNYDFVIGTATKPQLKEYPSPNKIAERMIVNEYDEYFRKNRQNLITTFQDDEIENKLNQ
ncbi:MAG: hypothetical protein WD357_05015 [Gracilimonas sp.]